MRSPVPKEIARRYILGRQGLWPGRRWAGKEGLAQALRYIECVQMDPLNVIARSHDLALWGRVLDYRPQDLDALLYHDRAFFDYGGNLRIYPMSELPYWRATMPRKGKEARWAHFAEQNRPLLREVKAELRARGPLGNNDFTGRSRVVSYRGRKDSALALYYLWLIGELMIHHRDGFERVYDLRDNVAPASLNYSATLKQAESYFARKTLALRGWCTAKSWGNWISLFTQRTVHRADAQRRLDRMVTAGEVDRVTVQGEKDPYYLLAKDAAALAALQDGQLPDDWRPLSTTTEEEAVFLAPLEPVIAYGRAKLLFDFDYVWEVYKPASKRKWGYYTLPVLYGDQLVARLDPKLERESQTVVVKGFWLEDEKTAKDADFAEALARGLLRLAGFVDAKTIDTSAVNPPRLEKHIRTRLKEFALHKPNGARLTPHLHAPRGGDMKFRTKILQTGKTAAGIEVPPKVVESLGSGKKPPVRVTINGYTYRSTIATLGGKFMVGVSAENRAKAGVAGGDVVDVDIQLDTAPREVTVPPDFAAALKRDPAARRFFDTLSYSNKQRHVLSIEGAKTEETRQRRIAKSISTLREGKA